jgi:hypothetical protein
MDVQSIKSLGLMIKPRKLLITSLLELISLLLTRLLLENSTRMLWSLLTIDLPLLRISTDQHPITRPSLLMEDILLPKLLLNFKPPKISS